MEDFLFVNLPLSLQDTCYLFLIGHLHQFRDVLARLPYSLRHQLLLRLPAIDLQLLDESSIWNGLEKDNYWKAIRCRLKGVDSETISGRAKNELLSEISLFVHQNSAEVKPEFFNPVVSLFATPYSFTVPSCAVERFPFFQTLTSHLSPLGLEYRTTVSKFSDCLVIIFPSRLTTLLEDNPFHSAVGCQLTAMKVLLYIFNQRSKCLVIDNVTIFIKDRQFVEDFFSSAEAIKAVCSDKHQYQEFPRMLVNILIKLTSPNTSRLKQFSIVDYTGGHQSQTNSSIMSFLGLQMLVGYFAKGFGRPSGAPSHVPYTLLEEISVSRSFFKTVLSPQQSQQNVTFFNMLAAIIKNQTNLRAVRIQAGLLPSVSCCSLIAVLGDLVSRSCFERLTLDSSESGTMVLPVDLSLELFSKFLSVTATREQSIGMRGVTFVGSCAHNQPNNVRFTTSNFNNGKNYKSIYLVDTEISDCMVPVFSQVPHVFLNSVKVT